MPRNRVRRRKLHCSQNEADALQDLEEATAEAKDILNELSLKINEVKDRVQHWENKLETARNTVLPSVEILLKMQILDCIPESLAECLLSGLSRPSSTLEGDADSALPSALSTPTSTSSTSSAEHNYYLENKATTYRCSVRETIFWKLQEGGEHFCDQELVHSKTHNVDDILKQALTSEERRFVFGEELVEAAEEGRVEDALKLLDAGADVNYCSSAGWTPLLRAVLFAKDKVVSLLLERGANVRDRTNLGNSVMHLAAFVNRNPCVFLLMVYGADVHSKNEFGDTPLHAAACLGNEAVARELVAAGSLLAIKNIYGETAFDVAMGEGLRQILRP